MNYPIWRRQKPRKKKQVCHAACLIAAENKYSEFTRLSRDVSGHFQENARKNVLHFGMPHHRQDWLDFGHGLLIFLLLASIWLSETGQIWSLGVFSAERMVVYIDFANQMTSRLCYIVILFIYSLKYESLVWNIIFWQFWCMYTHIKLAWNIQYP